MRIEGDSASGATTIYFQDIALVSGDGSVRSIYTRQKTFTSPGAGGPGFTSTGYEMNHGVWAPGLAPNPWTTTAFYHGDHLGSSRQMSSPYGYPVWEATYLPFGQEHSPPGAAPSPAPGGQHYKFTGKERDSESGLDNFGARYFASTMGRFQSPDPQNAGAIPEDPQSWNAYAYARNNPLIYTDPDGLKYLLCDTDENCVDDYADADFEKNFLNDKSVEFKGNEIYKNGELIGTFQRLSFDDLSSSANAVLFDLNARAPAMEQFIYEFEKESVKAAVAGAVIGKVVEAGVGAYAAYRGAQAAASEATNLMVRAAQTVGNRGAVASSKEVAVQAAEQWVGVGARPIMKGGEVIGKISADGQRVYRITSINKAEPYVNLVNRTTGGNLHVRF